MAPVTEDTEPGPETESQQLQVSLALQGERLDKALAVLLPAFSRSYLQQRIAEGDVLLGGRAQSKASARVRLGDVLQVTLRETPQSQAFVPEPMALEVLHEDAHLRVIHKPAGLVVHPAPGHWRGTLLNGLLALDPQAVQLPRAGIVHRLDKDTSGLMVVARTRQAMDLLVAAIAAREVRRQYLAVSAARWRWAQPQDFVGAIGRDPGNRLRMAVVDLQRQAGKPARTTVECLDQSELACLLLCSLHTGRTHQIRVHLSHAGYPLVGDALYGGRPLGGLHRQALHAWRLAFSHPVTGQALDFECPPPEDLRQLLAETGLRYN
ncbi:MAG: RluA family pseudouridine synthase [Limnohabitans sp.]